MSFSTAAIGLMNGGRAVRSQVISWLNYASDQMTGPDLCLHRDVDVDIDYYRFHGRNGIYVSRMCF